MPGMIQLINIINDMLKFLKSLEGWKKRRAILCDSFGEKKRKKKVVYNNISLSWLALTIVRLNQVVC